MNEFKRLVLLMGIIFIMMPQEVDAQYFRFDPNAPNQQIESEVNVILKFFGSIVGGGMFHTADLHGTGGFDVGLRGTVAKVPSEFKGLPVFSEENLLGLAFAHASLGLPGNFEVIGRFFTMPLGSNADLSAARPLDSRGDITLIGAGIKYGLIQLPGLPKVMVMASYHALLVPDEFDFGTVNVVSFKGVISHSLPLLTVYAGAGVDISRLKLNPQFLNGASETESLSHLTVGAKVSPFPFVYVNASYNISDFPSFDFGVGINFR